MYVNKAQQNNLQTRTEFRPECSETGYSIGSHEVTHNVCMYVYIYTI